MPYARRINSFSESSTQILDQKFKSKVFENLAKTPVSAISRIHQENAALLKRIFGIGTIRELTENKYILIAQTIVAMASMLQILRALASCIDQTLVNAYSRWT